MLYSELSYICVSFSKANISWFLNLQKSVNYFWEDSASVWCLHFDAFNCNMDRIISDSKMCYILACFVELCTNICIYLFAKKIMNHK